MRKPNYTYIPDELKKNPGRKRTNRRYSIGCKVTPEELEQLENEARSENIAVNQLLRKRLGL